MPHCNTEVFKAFLDTLWPGRLSYTRCLVLNNADWHKAKQLHW